MNDSKAIEAIKRTIAESEKVTASNGFGPAKVAKARQIIAQLKQDLRRLETKVNA